VRRCWNRVPLAAVGDSRPGQCRAAEPVPRSPIVNRRLSYDGGIQQRFALARLGWSRAPPEQGCHVDSRNVLTCDGCRLRGVCVRNMYDVTEAASAALPSSVVEMR
jgi:hypothetical protein